MSGLHITDSQVHVWAPETAERPWIPGGRSFAHADEYSAAQLITEMDAAGIERVVLVPPAFEGDRNDVSLAAVAEYPGRVAVMGKLSVADPASRGQLDGWRSTPGMLGLRLSFGRGAAAGWLQDGTADWIWGEAEEAGVPIMVFAPGQLDRIERIARQHPGLRLIVDHLGFKPADMEDELDPILDQLVAMRDLPNVAVKASCLPSHVNEPFPFRSLHPRIRRVVEAFGPRRVFWGSDLTRLSSTLGEAVRLFTEELDFLSADDLEWIMGRGVTEWIGWATVEESQQTAG